MPSSFVEIANSAIVKVGGRSIQSLDDDTVEAKTCKLRMEPCKRIVLRMHPWNFAIERVSLAPLVSTPAFEFSAEFQLPSDCLRVLAVGPEDNEYRIEGRKIRMSSSEVQLAYIQNVADPTLFDDLFAEALACYLAWDSCFKLTQKADARAECWRQFEMIKRQAKSVDAQEERDYGIEANLFVDSRISGTSPGRSNR